MQSRPLEDDRRRRMLTYADVCCRSAQVLGGIGDLSKTLVLVASKSGGTLETLTNEKMVRNYLRAHAKRGKGSTAYEM